MRDYYKTISVKHSYKMERLRWADESMSIKNIRRIIKRTL